MSWNGHNSLTTRTIYGALTVSMRKWYFTLGIDGVIVGDVQLFKESLTVAYNKMEKPLAAS